MKGNQALSCPIHGKNKSKNALFNYRRRVEKSRGWYAQHGGGFHVVRKRATGVDCNRAVGFRTLKPGKQIEQWVRVNGKPGIDFTEPGTPPGTLGIRMDSTTGKPAGRVLKRFTVEKEIRVMRSRAADLPDEVAELVGGKGGGPQITMPPGWEKCVRMEGL